MAEALASLLVSEFSFSWSLCLPRLVRGIHNRGDRPLCYVTLDDPDQRHYDEHTLSLRGEKARGTRTNFSGSRDNDIPR